MRHYAFFEGDHNQSVPSSLYLTIMPLPAHIGHGTLFAIGFPDNGEWCSAHVKYFVSLLPVLIPMSPSSDHFTVQIVTSSSPLAVLVPYGQSPSCLPYL